MRGKKKEEKKEEVEEVKGTEKVTIKDYLKYVRYLQDHNWHKESVTIHDLNSRLATINNINANEEGIVIDIKCPPGLLICVPGINNFPENYHIEKIPHLEIKLANSNSNEEPSPDTKIKILKKKILHKDEDLCELEYKDISITNFNDSPNKYKYYRELFRFKNGIELKGEDHLKLMVINPNIDINDVKFNLALDLFTHRD